MGIDLRRSNSFVHFDRIFYLCNVFDNYIVEFNNENYGKTMDFNY